MIAGVKYFDYTDYDESLTSSLTLTELQMIKKAAFILLFAGSVFAQSTHSKLKDPDLLKKFQDISNKILCTCGCNLPLYYCNHIGHCNGWPMRQIIDELLAEGKSQKFIEDGFIKGFPSEMVDNHKAFTLARSEQYSYLVPMFKKGLGEAGKTEPDSKWPQILAALTGLVFLGVYMLYIRNKIRTKPNPDSSIDSETRNEILKKIEKED